MADEPILPPELWDACVNPDLPEGVVEFADSEGRWWRYPLIEYMVDE